MAARGGAGKLTGALAWRLRWGPFEKKLIELAEKGEDVPALRERVEVFADLVPIWRMFWHLSHRRRARELIAMTEIAAAVDVLGWSDIEERADVVELMLALDGTWRSTVNEMESQRG